MKDEHARRLDAVLTGYTEKAEQRAAQLEKSRTAEGDFCAEAGEAFKKVVRPAMEAIQAKLRDGRYDCDIVEQDETIANNMKTRPKSITMKVRVPPPRGPHVTRATHEVSFTVVSHEKTVSVTSSSSLGADQQPQPRTTFEVSKLTSDAVTGELVRFLEELIR
jgi:hypothetical protein